MRISGSQTVSSHVYISEQMMTLRADDDFRFLQFLQEGVVSMYLRTSSGIPKWSPIWY